MGCKNVQGWSARAWTLAERQHGIVTRGQLVDLGLSRRAIAHRIDRGRLFPLWRGVYAVGRREVTREGRWLAAVLACGEGALLSHRSAAALWGIRAYADPPIHVTVPAGRAPRRPGIRVHRRSENLTIDRASHLGIPVTGPATTLIDLAAEHEPQLEAAVNAANRSRLVDPETLRASADLRRGQPGAPRLLALLDEPTFAPTDSHLERRFLALIHRADLPIPLTQVDLHGYRVDFYWPDLGLVVETDGLHYHRTAQQQAKDLRRDQAHTAAGLHTLRFAAAQVFHEPAAVTRTLTETIANLRRA